jgi:hypothetical protein
MRLPTREDWIEELYWAVRTLMEKHETAPREIRRWVTQTVEGRVPAAIRNRIDADEAAS